MTGTTRTSPTGTSSALWFGWMWFAAIMMIMNGAFSLLYGLVALFRDTYYTVGPQGLLVFDLTQWGWILLVLGAVALLAGFALFRGALWARITVVALASVSILAHLAFMSAYPVWGLITIAIDVIVIWAVIVHGEALREAQR